MILVALGVLGAIMTGALAPLYGLLALGLVVAAVFWWMRDHLPSILFAFAAVLVIALAVSHKRPKVWSESSGGYGSDKLSRKWSASGSFNRNLPIVIHIVFDEMMSVGGMSDDIPFAARRRQSLLALATKHSLRMFDSVYARFYFTNESLPNMMNGGYGGHTQAADLYLKPQGDSPRNAYFDDMAARGYRTIVFQTSAINFCANKSVDRCETFDSFDPSAAKVTGLDPRNQRANLWQTIFHAFRPSYTSEMGQAILERVYGLRTHEVGVIGAVDRYDAQGFSGWFDRFAEFVTTVPRGTHVFAHFLVPHAPYLLTERCIVSGRFESRYFFADVPVAERSMKRRELYDGYFAQVGCVQQKLDGFLTAIDESQDFQDALIVIHGDHGSRISSGNILEDYTQRDFIDNYATFFAVRSPSVPPGIDCEFVSLPEVFRRYMAPSPVAPRSGGALPVFVNSRAAGNAKVEAPMPRFGCAANGTAAGL
jgi:hypothetical protein